ncbi:MAG: sigma factor [Pseudodesulfovibrio sp.]|uniref:sigma factor n=1 Tax=Pseudodesulfovibrio sp. TaxID=2035812 RepID=UPI003D0AB254
MEGVKERLRAGRLLYPMNMSAEKAVTKIRDSYPFETALWLARRELRIRKEHGEKKAKNYKKESPWIGFDFDLKPVVLDIPSISMEEKGVVDIIRAQAGFHLKAFQQLDRNTTFEDVLAEIVFIFMKCAGKFKAEGRASFNTYLNTAIRNHIRDLWRKQKTKEEFMAEYRRFVQLTDGHGYPVLQNGKWVAA